MAPPQTVFRQISEPLRLDSFERFRPARRHCRRRTSLESHQACKAVLLPSSLHKHKEAPHYGVLPYSSTYSTVSKMQEVGGTDDSNAAAGPSAAPPVKPKRKKPSRFTTSCLPCQRRKRKCELGEINLSIRRRSIDFGFVVCR